MSKLSLDFTGLAPATGSFGSDHIPRGEYSFIITNYSDKHTNAGKSQHAVVLTVADGDYAGCSVVDRFVESDKPFVRQRLMAMLLCVGIPVDAGRVVIDSGNLMGRAGRMVVKDNEMPANGEFPARITSQVAEYKGTDGRDAAAILADVRARKTQSRSNPQAPQPKSESAPEPSPIAAAEDAPALADVPEEIDSLFP